MSEEATLFCPQCKQHWPQANFECLPLDLRCNRCIPAETAMHLADKRVERAGRKIAQILDKQGTARDLKRLERMLSIAYTEWGGEHAFMADGVEWIKSMGDNPRTRGLAVNAWTKILQLHAKVDRMNLEDDWKQMDDATLEATVRMKLQAMAAEIIEGEVLDNAKKYISGESENLE